MPVARPFEATGRDEGISEAVSRWGYKLKEIGDFVGLYYSRASRIASAKAKSKTCPLTALQ